MAAAAAATTMAEDGGLDGGGGSCGNGDNNIAWLCSLKWKINVRNIVNVAHESLI